MLAWVGECLARGRCPGPLEGKLKPINAWKQALRVKWSLAQIIEKSSKIPNLVAGLIKFDFTPSEKLYFKIIYNTTHFAIYVESS